LFTRAHAEQCSLKAANDLRAPDEDLDRGTIVRVMDDGPIWKPGDVVDANFLAIFDRLPGPCLKLFDPQSRVFLGTSLAPFPTLKPGIIGPRVSGRRLAR
jgi:hypothetical protein